MLTDTKVRIFSSTMFGAPSANLATVGGLIQLLDACLVAGFAPQAMGSGAMTRAGNVVTVVFGAHRLYDHAVILIAGAAQADYNGEHRILVDGPDAFSFELVGALAPASPATGTITFRIAPAGWTKPFGDVATHKAVYRPADGPRHFLRVDDGVYAATKARVRAYRSMTDMDSGTGMYPTLTQAPIGWCNWMRPAISWWLVADDKCMYYVPQTINSVAGTPLFQFGWFKDLYSFDVDACSSLVVSSMNAILNNGHADLDEPEWQHRCWHSRFPTNNNYNADVTNCVGFLAKSFDGVQDSIAFGWTGYSMNIYYDGKAEFNNQGNDIYASMQSMGNLSGSGSPASFRGFTLVPPFINEPNYVTGQAALRGASPFLQVLSLYAAEANAGKVFRLVDKYKAVLSLVWGYQTYNQNPPPVKGLLLPLGNWEDVL